MLNRSFVIVNKYLYRRYREPPEERDIQQSEDVEFGTHPRFLKICIMSVLSYIPMAYSGYALRLLLLTCLPCRLQIKYIPLHRFWYPSRTLRKGLKGNRVRIPDRPAAVIPAKLLRQNATDAMSIGKVPEQRKSQKTCQDEHSFVVFGD